MNGFVEIFQHLDFLLLGLKWTIGVSVIAILGGSIVGLLSAIARLSNIWLLKRISILYIDFFRTTPLLIQLIWIYYALPLLIGESLDSLTAGVLTLSLYSGSYISEIIRAGILSISRGQTEAAFAIGMTRFQAYRRVILPQAIVRMLPPIGSNFISMVKESSLVSIIGLPDLMRQANALGTYTFRRMEAVTVVSGIYFLVAYPLSILVNYLHKRFKTD